MTTEEIIQYDLDAGRYGGICSNEDTFKAYVFRKIEEARNEGRNEVFRKIDEQKEEIIEIIKDLQIEVSDSHSGYINKLPQIQILDEIKQKINNLNK